MDALCLYIGAPKKLTLLRASVRSSALLYFGSLINNGQDEREPFTGLCIGLASEKLCCLLRPAGVQPPSSYVEAALVNKRYRFPLTATQTLQSHLHFTCLPTRLVSTDIGR